MRDQEPFFGDSQHPSQLAQCLLLIFPTHRPGVHAELGCPPPPHPSPRAPVALAHSGALGLTSFLRSLLSLCRCHLTRACGERAWHSRKVLLPSTPYCTISSVFLFTATRTCNDENSETSPRQPCTYIAKLWQSEQSWACKVVAMVKHHFYHLVRDVQMPEWC